MQRGHLERSAFLKLRFQRVELLVKGSHFARHSHAHRLRAGLEADEIRLRLLDMQQDDAGTKRFGHRARRLRHTRRDIGEIHRDENRFDVHAERIR